MCSTIMIFSNQRFQFAFRLSLFHFFISLFVAGLTAALVFLVWYPASYREILAVSGIYFLLLGVDVVCGPLLTLVLSNPNKSRKELALDLSLVVLIQLAALLYGLYSVGMGRPVALVMEKDRFVVVTAADVSIKHLQEAEAPFNTTFFYDIHYVGTRDPVGSDEFMQSLDLSLQGIPPSARPNWWISYDDSKEVIAQRSLPLQALLDRQEGYAKDNLESVINNSGHQIQELYYLPLVSHAVLDWSVILDSNYDIVTFVHVDGF